jgi:hypothetical protein
MPARHTIHSYYLASPESPDGSRILYYVSRAADGHHGDLVVLDRRTGRETTIAGNLETEDAHRAACQQWIDGGRSVAYHDLRAGRWGVYVVDLDSRRERVVALDRQLAFGVPGGTLLPIHGCHWNPGNHRDLELADVATGEIHTVLGMDAVKQAYGDWLKQEFSGKPTSIFFPILSPDRTRVFFKIACGSGGDVFRSAKASQRQGLIAYDLAKRRFLFMRPTWGHPAWHPDSRQIFEVGNLLFDLNDKGSMRRVPELPKPGGCHPSLSPDGRLVVMDGKLEEPGAKPGQWGIWVCDLRSGQGRWESLYRFDNARGAKSWRKNHPHPVFSPDGKRIYFNVSATDWTQLYVAECSTRDG